MKLPVIIRLYVKMEGGVDYQLSLVGVCHSKTAGSRRAGLTPVCIHVVAGQRKGFFSYGEDAGYVLVQFQMYVVDLGS